MPRIVSSSPSAIVTEFWTRSKTRPSRTASYLPQSELCAGPEAAAGRRCLQASFEVGGVVLVIDAKNDRGASWYAGYGAMPLMDAPLTLVLPLATIETALRRVRQANAIA